MRKMVFQIMLGSASFGLAGAALGVDETGQRAANPRKPFDHVQVAAADAGESAAPLGAHHPHRIPQQAISACEGKQQGAACSFTNRRDVTVSGTCNPHPIPVPTQAGQPQGQDGNASVLACRPTRNP